MNYLAIAQQCREYSRSKLFVATTFEDAPIRLCCIHAEISELQRAIEAGELRNQALESADVACYALLMLIDLGCESWEFRERIHGGPKMYRSPAELVAPLRAYVDMAFERWRRDDKRDLMICLELLIAMLVDVRTRCLRLPNSLQQDIQHKLALNAGRAACHGKNNRS